MQRPCLPHSSPVVCHPGSVDGMCGENQGVDDVVQSIVAWFADAARTLPWRSSDVTSWGVLVSEVMLQQTPTARVAPVWEAWMKRWPTPSALAAASPDEVLRAWGRLGYPRRALRLRAAADAVEERHGGELPETESDLLALPGVGSYTAAAVLAFAYRRRSLVLDVNVRRVLARIDQGVEHPARSETAGERERGWRFVPDGDEQASLWAAASMELGATVCTAKSPKCGPCPVAAHCSWRARGYPAWDGPPRVAQSWEGTDRQCRGRIMAALRESSSPVPLIDLAWPDSVQLARCADSLVADGLAVRHGPGLSLPVAEPAPADSDDEPAVA